MVTAVQQSDFTWPKALGVADSNQAGVVHFSLQGEQRDDSFVLARHLAALVSRCFAFCCVSSGASGSYRQRGVLIQLVLGSDAEAGVVAASGPGQGHGGLQLVVHLLVDGAAELGPVVTARTKGGG